MALPGGLAGHLKCSWGKTATVTSIRRICGSDGDEPWLMNANICYMTSQAVKPTVLWCLARGAQATRARQRGCPVGAGWCERGTDWLTTASGPGQSLPSVEHTRNRWSCPIRARLGFMPFPSLPTWPLGRILDGSARLCSSDSRCSWINVRLLRGALPPRWHVSPFREFGQQSRGKPSSEVWA